MRTCMSCGGALPTIRHKWCAACKRLKRNQYLAAQRVKDPDRVRSAKRACALYTNYGVTVAQYIEMLQIQGGVCAICRERETATVGDQLKNFHVDHDHKTLTVRGLLCTRCNVGLGSFGDDVELLRKAQSYLRDHAQVC